MFSCSRSHFASWPSAFVSTHLGKVLQGKRLCHVVKLRTTHGFGHGQHSQTVGGCQLLLWKTTKGADGETNVDGERKERGKKKGKCKISLDGLRENLSACGSKSQSNKTSRNARGRVRRGSDGSEEDG